MRTLNPADSLNQHWSMYSVFVICPYVLVPSSSFMLPLLLLTQKGFIDKIINVPCKIININSQLKLFVSDEKVEGCAIVTRSKILFKSMTCRIFSFCIWCYWGCQKFTCQFKQCGHTNLKQGFKKDSKLQYGVQIIWGFSYPSSIGPSDGRHLPNSCQPKPHDKWAPGKPIPLFSASSS